jgi:hypothetical protein
MCAMRYLVFQLWMDHLGKLALLNMMLFVLVYIHTLELGLEMLLLSVTILL